MTDNMPREIWALDNQLEYPRLWEREYDEDGTKYIHHTTHEAALQALKVARDAFLSVDRGVDIYGDDILIIGEYEVEQALEQINKILGDE